MAAAKVLMLALAVTGVTATGVVTGVVHIPLEKAIQIHKDRFGPDSNMPEQSLKGQQTALDHLVANQERWTQNNQDRASSFDNDTAESD